MRKIKFRVYNTKIGKWVKIDLSNIIFDEEGEILANAFIELMQFTGLYDKKGKEIYEGDIVKFNSEMIGVIEWWQDKYWAKRISDNSHHPIRYKDMEIIGNIFGNPELLDYEKPNNNKS